MPQDGDITRRNGKVEFWQRCPICGDSVKHPDKAHYSINLDTGEYYCFRCQSFGGVEPGELFELQFTYNFVSIEAEKLKLNYTSEKVKGWMDVLKEGPAEWGNTEEPRLSGIHDNYRYHIITPKGEVDCFLLRKLDGEVTGIHMRATWEKKARTLGLRTFLYNGPDFYPGYIRVVEGPYDIVNPQMDLALCGGFGWSQIRALTGVPIILALDGDVWLEPKKVKNLTRQLPHLLVLAVEIFKNGRDPGDTPIKKRMVLDYDVFMKEFLPKLQKEKEEKKYKPVYTLSPVELFPELEWEVV